MEWSSGLMLSGSKLKTAIAKVGLIAVHGPWSRCVAFRHLVKPSKGKKGGPLWGGASAINGARFTPKGGFDSLYLAWDPVTTLLEVQALIAVPGGPVPLRTPPWVLMTIEGIVANVLDLTDTATLNALKSTEMEMTGTWVTSANSPTQELAQTAYDSGKIAAIKYASAKHPSGMNLVVFPDLLVKNPSYLEVFHPHLNLIQRIGPK
jgi:RES domain-containing protein